MLLIKKIKFFFISSFFFSFCFIKKALMDIVGGEITIGITCLEKMWKKLSFVLNYVKQPIGVQLMHLIKIIKMDIVIYMKADLILMEVAVQIQNVMYMCDQKVSLQMSKPNERSCGIFLEKLSGFSPPCDPFCFCGKNFFFEFSEKMSNFFFNEIDCKKFSKFFSMNSAVKNLDFFFQ